MVLELPWTPLYTQSGGFGGAGGGTSTSTSEDESQFGYYALAATVAFTVFVYTFEGSLDSRQKASYQKTDFPKQLEVTVAKIDEERKKKFESDQKSKDKQQQPQVKKEEEDKKNEGGEGEESKKEENETFKPLLDQLKSKFVKAQSYGLDKINFGMIASTYDTFESVTFLMIGFMPYMWDLSVAIGRGYFGWTSQTDNEIYISLIFLLMVTIVGTITSLPFELYSTFQIEKKHGFNKQTYGLFVTDKIKSLLLTCIIGGPFIALLLKIIKMGGDYFYIYVWGFMFCFSVFMMTIVPVVIMPMFNKYEPLQDGELKTKIHELAAQINYPLKKLFVMDGSKRSSHSNAFMFGFGNNKRIVLFDTLMEQVHDDEILAILGHELGHWKLGHTLTNFAVTQVYFGSAFYFFAQCYTSKDLFAAFGFDDPNNNVPTVIALMLFFQSIWAPVDKILSFILTVFSRHCEFGADEFSVDLNMSAKLQSGLCKIHLENLGAMCPDPLYSMYHYSHPPLVERLSAMMLLDKKKA